jgi:hypothetical protein
MPTTNQDPYAEFQATTSVKGDTSTKVPTDPYADFQGATAKEQETSSADTKSQPSTWQTLIQPTEKTDKDYLNYRGAAGVAGATVHGLNKIAEGTLGAVKSIPQGIMSDIKGGHVPLIHSMITEPAKQLVSDIPQIPGYVRDINASSDPLGHYAEAAEDTASQGAGQALTGIAAAKLPEATPPLIRGAGKVYNAALENAPNVAGGIGAIKGAMLSTHDPLAGGYVGWNAGKSAGQLISKYAPKAPESVTHFGEPTAAPKPSIGRVPTEAPAEPLIKKPSAPAEAAVKPSEPREYSPEDLDKLDKTVAQLPNSNLQSLGKRLGLDESKYDFSKREAVREGGSKHAVDRDRFTKDTQEKLPGALRDHIIDATNDWEKANPQTFESPARNSKFWADRSNAIISDAVNRWQPETEKPSMPKIGAGAKVKSLGDLSKVTQALMKSLQVSPTKVLEELEGNESQIRTRLLKASAEDLARWK